MTEKLKLKLVDRRDFLLGVSAATLAVTLPFAGDQAFAKGAEDVIKEIVGDVKAEEAKVTLELPEIAENGNTVPFVVSVDSPMSDDDYVKVVHVFATGNPAPHVTSLHFTPLSGKAWAKSRMRLGQTQDIVAIAETSKGKHYMGKRTVKVTIGGCGG